jgi:heme A synthase
MEIYNILLQAHRGFAYLELALVAAFLILLLVTMFGYSGNISKALRKVTLFTMIFFHVQFLIGLTMLITTFTKGLDMSAVMKNADLRFQYVEHPFSMLIAAVLMTVINKKLKTADKLTIRLMSLGFVAIALFVFAFPWARVFGA